MKPKRAGALSNQTERQGAVTKVRLSYELLDVKPIRALGVTRCSKNDVYSDEVGENIALGRALKDLGSKIEARGNSSCVTKKEWAKVAHMMDRAFA